MSEVIHERCRSCKCWRLPSCFLNDTGRRLKTCSNCRTFSNNMKLKKVCEHGNQKHQCKTCNLTKPKN